MSPSAAISAKPSNWRSAIRLMPLLLAGAWQMAAALQLPDLWWLRWIALIPLFLAIRFLPNFSAAMCGAIWGASLYIFSRAEPASGISASGWLLLTIVPAAFAWVSAELTRRRGFHPLLLALCWVGVELVVAPQVTEHGFLASTRGDGLVSPAFGGFAGGWLMASFVLAAINAVIVAALLEIERSFRSTRILRITSELSRVIECAAVILAPVRLVRVGQPRAPPSVPSIL